MAAPLAPQVLLDALRGEGLTVVEYPGWRDRCRCHSGSHERGEGTRKPFEPLAVAVHITAGDLGSRSMATYIRDILANPNNGNTPLGCNFAVAPDGVVWLVAAGRAEHVLYMGSRAMAALKAGSMSIDSWQDLSGREHNGSRYLYGIENVNSGPANAAQQRASERIIAAICRAYGWSGRDAAGHGEVAADRGYADPGVNVGLIRRAAMNLVGAAAPAGAPSTGDGELDATQNDWLRRACAAAEVAVASTANITNGMLFLIERTVRIEARLDDPDRILTPDEVKAAVQDVVDKIYNQNPVEGEAGQ